MNENDQHAYNGQDGDAKQENKNTVVFDGGTYSDPATTKADVDENDDMEHGDHSYTTQTYTNDLPKNAYSESGNDDPESDDDFDDFVGEDDLPDADGFEANSDNPNERELTKTWIGNEKTMNDAKEKPLEGDPMGGENFGTSELEQKNNRDASSREHHSLGLGSSALNQPSEEISNPPEIEDGGEHPDRKKVRD